MAQRGSCSSGQPLFTPVTHPELRRLGRKPVHIFLRDREKYLLRIKDAQDSGSSITPVSLRSSVDRDLLESLISFGHFEGVERFGDLTDELIQNFLDQKDGAKLESVSLEQLEASMKSAVKLNIHESDAEMRIMSLFMDYRTYLRNKRWERLIDDSLKITIQHITSLLKPTVLRKKIQEDIKLNVNSIKENWTAFYAKVCKRAVDVDEYFSVMENTEEPDKGSGNCAGSPTCSHNKVGHEKAQKKSKTRPNTGSNNESDQKDKSPPGKDTPRETGGQKADGKPLPDCLNPKCPEKHYLKDCTNSTEEQKKEFLKTFRENRKLQSRTSRAGVSNADENQELKKAPRKGLFAGKLADVVKCTVNGDYGSDHAALCEQHLQELADAGVFVSVLPLPEPVRMGLAMESQEVFEAKRKARISTTIQTLAGPLRFRNLEFLVFNEDMPEVLLSRPLLQAIGFNLDKHLADVRDRYHDVDFSHIGFSQSIQTDGDTETPEPGRLSKLLLTNQKEEGEQTEPIHTDQGEGKFYGDMQGDDPLFSDDPIETGEDDTTETELSLDRIIQEATDSGLSPEEGTRLKHLVFGYKDIFRTKIGGDPPADVPAMKIVLKKNAEPVRMKPRRYSPPQAVFLRTKVDELQRKGLVKPNNRSRWACAPLIVPKPGPEQFRFTVDLRPVNSQTEPHPWPMPDMETVSSQVTGDVCYASLDLCQGFWQLPLDEESQECQSFITPDGVFSPTRVLHGATNAVEHSAANNVASQEQNPSMDR